MLFLGLAAVPAAHGGRAGLPIEPEAWASYGYDNQLTNSIATQALTPRSVSRLAPLWSTQLDGAVYASPLAAKVGGRLLVFAAKEAGNVYAVNSADGRVVWQRSLGAVQTAECGSWGITSTGAIDLERGFLFEISADGLLHALAFRQETKHPVTPSPSSRTTATSTSGAGCALRTSGSTSWLLPIAMPALPADRWRKAA
jgi:outer membrane protein assembly factor BamB